MSTTDESLSAVAGFKRIRGLRTNSFAAAVMLLIEFGLGMWVNLYANLPPSDHGKGILAAFGHAVTEGPVALSLHALLGTLLLISGISAVLRAVSTRQPLVISLAAVALLAILAAWGAGARFVGDMGKGPSLTMAIATMVALLCCLIILFVLSPLAKTP